jgi:hypothetical protein
VTFPDTGSPTMVGKSAHEAAPGVKGRGPGRCGSGDAE